MTNEVPAAPRCFNCGADARWRDDLTGAHRCHGCVITSGGGRPHVVVATEPDDGHDDDDTVADEPDQRDKAQADEVFAASTDVWDRLEAEIGDMTDPAAREEWIECVMAEGKEQAMALDRAYEQRGHALYLLAVFVHAHATRNVVPPHIDDEARALVRPITKGMATT